MPTRRTVVLRGLLHPAAGPVVRIRVHGEVSVPGVAVLDTGASMSVIDRQLARDLDLESPGAAEWMGVNATGERSHAALRTARLEFLGDGRRFPMDLLEVPELRRSVPGLDIIALLGWDFLLRCRLVCDGPAGTFELTLPAGGWRR